MLCGGRICKYVNEKDSCGSVGICDCVEAGRGNCIEKRYKGERYGIERCTVMREDTLQLNIEICNRAGEEGLYVKRDCQEKETI